MGFFTDAWKGVKRLFKNKCPKCGVSDADLSPKEQIIVNLIRQKPQAQSRYIPAQKRMMSIVIWNITERFRCQKCGHSWYKTRNSLRESGAQKIRCTNCNCEFEHAVKYCPECGTQVS